MHGVTGSEMRGREIASQTCQVRSVLPVRAQREKISVFRLVTPDSTSVPPGRRSLLDGKKGAADRSGTGPLRLASRGCLDCSKLESSYFLLLVLQSLLSATSCFEPGHRTWSDFRNSMTSSCSALVRASYASRGARASPQWARTA